MLNLREVQAFVAVVDAGAFHKAAGRLGLFQPTISQQVKKLEESVRARLVTRDRSVRCAAMASGLRLLLIARALLRTAARAADVSVGRTLVIGASSNIGIYILPPIANRFAAAQAGETGFPEIVIGTNPQTASRLDAGEVDVAVMEWWDARAGFVAPTWRWEPLVIIVPKRHPWTKLSVVPRRALLAAPWIGGEPGTGTGRLIREIFGKAADQLRMTMTLGSTEAVKAAVRAGLGVSLVTLSSVEQELRTGSLCAVPIKGAPTLQKELVVVLPQDAPSTAPAHAFATMLRATVARQVDQGRRR
jgi:DNA-binding transcriptional LysR family regulator